jgi:hypothetical protein
MGLEILYAIGALVLLVAFIWGANHYRNRRQGERTIGDDTTERLYRRSGDPEA